MLPWSLSFAFFNGVIGLYYGTIKQANLAKEKLIVDLQNALAEVKKLSGMLPICSSCKKIRDDEGYWQALDENNRVALAVKRIEGTRSTILIRNR